MSNAFQIRGGKPLSGEITPQGAKNEALQILCAVLLTGDEVRIKNIPDIKDVNQLIDILRDLGVIITKMVRVITPSKQITLISIISSLRNSK
nr:hypothetical protein [Elizabethkingia bruuniana]